MSRSYLQKNEAGWDAHSPEYQKLHQSQLPIEEPTWGVWGIPEAELKVLGDVSGNDVLEFGCGGAQWSIALARRGARVTGIDLSRAQLAFAQELVARNNVTVRLLHANAEAVPLPDASFDIIFCDHGGMTFADPYRTIPEAARLLRPGGLLAWNSATPLLYVCCNEKNELTESLCQDYFALHQIEESEGVSFQLPYGKWIRLFRQNQLTVEDLLELQPPEGTTTTYTSFAPLSWARRWPAEQIWKLRKLTA
jgi:SAM-dependent methyltransferase